MAKPKKKRDPNAPCIANGTGYSADEAAALRKIICPGPLLVMLATHDAVKEADGLVAEANVLRSQQ